MAKSERKPIPHHLRLAVIERDGCTCQYCGKVGVFVYRYGFPSVIEASHQGQKIKIQKTNAGRRYYNGNDVIAFEIDHIIPVISGGESIINNLILSCRKCNRSKGASHGRR